LGFIAPRYAYLVCSVLVTARRHGEIDSMETKKRKREDTHVGTSSNTRCQEDKLVSQLANDDDDAAQEVKKSSTAETLLQSHQSGPVSKTQYQEDVVVSQLPKDESEQHIKYDNFYTPNNRPFYKKFQYLNLIPTKRHFRLLRIHPLQAHEVNTAPIVCDLLDDNSLAEMEGKFTTISYCAGDPKRTEAIVVNYLNFNAFANLGHALRQARHFWGKHHSDRELLIWVDQVCIDQSNPSERSHQVGFMGEIYAAAEQVLVCLSTEKSSVGGIRWLKGLQEHLSLHLHDMDTRKEYRESHHRVSRHDYLNSSMQDATLYRGFSAFTRCISDSPWWRRAWVRQEFVRSREAYFLASYDCIHWGSVAQVFHWLEHSFQWELDEDRHYQLICTFEKIWINIRAVNSLFLARTGGAVKNLASNLLDVHRCESSDPRDLIYAFFGISDHTCQPLGVIINQNVPPYRHST
jgi:hypothetical protein